MGISDLLIVDGHLDLATNALGLRRDLTQPVQVLRDRDGGARPARSTHKDALDRKVGPLLPSQGPATVSLPAMRAGRVGIVVATVMCRVQASTPDAPFTARTREAAYAVARSHLAYYHALVRDGELAWVRDVGELDACLRAWETPTPRTPVGLILSMEGADSILEPDQVAEWHAAGLRALSLTHIGANVYGHGTGSRGGLFPPAYPLMDALRKAGIVLDLTHAADLAFWQILEHWDGPVHASHANCRALVRGQRHLSDEMITAIAKRGGVVGMVFAEQMLNPAWHWDDPATHRTTATRSMSAVAEHVDHICQLLGNADHVALGSDLDGGFGRDLAPIDLDTIADLQGFVGILRARGFREEDVRKITHGNLIRFFRKAWGSET
jgi:membrane dipeptidase